MISQVRRGLGWKRHAGKTVFARAYTASDFKVIEQHRTMQVTVARLPWIRLQ